MNNIATLIAGILFGLGLVLSGMSDPIKVQNFFAVFGAWDPSLALVMVGAIGVALPGFWLVTKPPQPMFHDLFHLPTSTDLDARLISGAAIFGSGWGLAGYCPGPGIVNVSALNSGALVFVATMLVGTGAAKFAIVSWTSRRKAQVDATPSGAAATT